MVLSPIEILKLSSVFCLSDNMVFRPAPGTAGYTLARSAPTNQQSSTTLSPSEVSIVLVSVSVTV